MGNSNVKVTPGGGSGSGKASIVRSKVGLKHYDKHSDLAKLEAGSRKQRRAAAKLKRAQGQG